MTSQVMQIVRSVAHNGIVYNDKMIDGGRSVKVPGLSDKHYATITGRLTQAGYTVATVVTRPSGCSMTKGSNTRLHIS